MKYLLFAILALLAGCSTPKQVTKNEQTKADIKAGGQTVKDSTRVTIIKDDSGTETTTEKIVTTTNFDAVVTKVDGHEVVLAVPKQQTQTTNRQVTRSTETKLLLVGDEGSTERTWGVTVSKEKEKQEATKPAKDPKTLRYVFYIMLLVSIIGAVFYVGSKWPRITDIFK